MKELEAIIAEQQKGKEQLAEYAIGEQLKEMAIKNPAYIDILKKDLSVDEMNLESAAKKLKEYADKNHGQERVFCITPIVAESILKEFYKLPDTSRDLKKDENTEGISYIDIGDFL